MRVCNAVLPILGVSYSSSGDTFVLGNSVTTGEGGPSESTGGAGTVPGGGIYAGDENFSG